jgi:hypothetical protein
MKIGERYQGYNTIIEIIGLPGAWEPYRNYSLDYPLALPLITTQFWKIGRCEPASFRGNCQWKLMRNQMKPEKEI